MDANPAIRMLENGIPFVERCGFKIETLERGRVVCRMPIEGNTNHIGTMYAGALFTCAEMPGGALFFSTFDPAKCFPIVKALDLQFLKPATTDVRLEISITDEAIARIDAALEANGKAEFVLEGELTDAQGAVVARSRGVYQLRATNPPKKPA
jgi:acyl-coenzyme A thioesterase PaaI-like protein